MNSISLKIFIDRLKDGACEKIAETFSPSMIDIHNEIDIFFPENISIIGKAYLANTHLMIELALKSYIKMPCSICNEFVEIPIEDNFSIIQEIIKLTSSIYDYTEDIRSALLLKIPHFTECSKGNCCERKELQKYLKNSHSKEAFLSFSEICKDSFL